MSEGIEIPHSYFVGGSELYSTSKSEDEIFKDPRGYVHVWEEPIPQAKYIMALDPTHGISGWSPGTKRDTDSKTDNAAIEIYRVDALKRIVYRDGKPVYDPQTKGPQFVWSDLQVAEFFAPVDAVESARIAFVLGQLYRGDAEEQCELIYESWPGPGILTTQELLRIGYMNLWLWEYISGQVAEETNRYGWQSSEQSQRLLWQRARRHLQTRRAKVLSPWLLAEYRTAVIDPNKMRAQAEHGAHDDLIQASSMAFWAGHKWTQDPESQTAVVTENRRDQDWQQHAPTLDDDTPGYRDAWRESVDNW